MKVLIEGPILTRSGYGEHARFVYRSIKNEEGLDIYINPLNWGNTGWLTDLQDPDEKSAIEVCVKKFSDYFNHAQNTKTQMHFDLHIHIGILNEFEKKAPQAISVTAGIETDRVDPSWIAKTHEQKVDKIIVPSTHSRDGFSKTSYQFDDKKSQTTHILELRKETDLQVVPYPLKQIPEESINLNIDTKFNFLSVALLGPRKGLENMVRWFVEEFKEEESVGLVLKTSKMNGSIIDRRYTVKHIENALKKHKDRKCKVYVLHGDLSEGELHSLYKSPNLNCYVSATHGEGYGLPIFEAAYSGMPIIATNWSGHLDFLSAEIKEGGKTRKKPLFAKVDYDLKEIQKSAVWNGILMEGSKWAHPRASSFKKQLRNVYKNYGMYKKWANVLKANIEKTHSENVILEKMRNSILGSTESSKEEEVFIL